MKKRLIAFLLLLTCLTAALPCGEASAEAREELRTGSVPIRISEVMTKNRATLRDLDGDFPDWIELENASDTDWDITGWALSKNNGKTVWVFPAFTLYANSRLVVFASKKDRPWPESELHTNFAISEWDSVTLLDAAGNSVSTCQIPEDKADYSYALQTEGNWETTPWATPGFENSAQGYDFFMRAHTSPGPIVINEVCVHNVTSYYHEVIGYSDWVEIKNISDSAVDLAQYRLSDDVSDLQRFALSGLLSPGQLLIVLCNEDFAAYSGYMQMAPFSLNSEREQLYLSTADGTIIDYAALHEIPYQKTYGRVSNFNGFYYLYQESPGKENGAGERRVSGTPILAGRDGVFDDVVSVPVELSASGDIYYTLDGSEPTASSIRYTEPLNVNRTSVVRAISVEPGSLPSRAATFSFIINERHTLPVASLVTDSPVRFQQVYVNGMKNAEVPGCFTYYDENGRVSSGCGIKMHGFSSLNMPKKNLSLRFRGAYGSETLEYDLFGGGVTSFTNLVLRAGQDQNNTIVRNEACYQLAAEFSKAVFTERFRYCVLYVNGVYSGIYAVEEKPNEAMTASRLGVKEDDIEMEEATTFHGDLYNKTFTFIYNHDMSQEENFRQVEESIDIDSLIDWCVLQATFGNYDLAEGNLRYARDVTHGGRWKLLLYDLDVAFFHYSYCVANVFTFGNQISSINSKLIASPIYRERFLSRASEAYHGVLSAEHMCAVLDALAEVVAPEVERDTAFSRLTVDSWREHLSSLKAQISNGWIGLNVDALCKACYVTPEEREFYFGDLPY